MSSNFFHAHFAQRAYHKASKYSENFTELDLKKPLILINRGKSSTSNSNYESLTSNSKYKSSTSNLKRRQ